MTNKQKDSGLIVSVCISLAIVIVSIVLIGGGGSVSDVTHKSEVTSVDSIPQRFQDDHLTESGLQTATTLVGRSDVGLFRAICIVESGDNIHAIGLNGELGAYQITKDYWLDAIEYGGVDWKYISNVCLKYKCEQVMLWYWERYQATSDEEKARMHNGGPQGMEKESTLKYWHKVQEVLSNAVLP